MAFSILNAMYAVQPLLRFFTNGEDSLPSVPLATILRPSTRCIHPNATNTELLPIKRIWALQFLLCDKCDS